MINSSEDSFLEQAWQLSILVPTSSKKLDSETIVIVGWIHIIEFVFIITTIIAVIFFHVLLVKNSKLKIMHNNLKVFFNHEIGVFYCVQILRFAIFCCAFSRSFTSFSLFGPLKILHIFRESGLMIGASAFVELTIDRLFSTLDPEGYEKQERPYISFILILFMYSYVAIIETLRYNEIMSMIFMPIIVGALSIITLPILVWLYRENKVLLEKNSMLSLNEKFQIRENIRICILLVPGAFGFSVCILMFALLYFLIYILEEKKAYVTALYLSTIFNFGLQILFLITVVGFTLSVPEMREQTVNFFYCRPMVEIRRHEIMPIGEARTIYFNNLRDVWATPRSSSFKPET